MRRGLYRDDDRPNDLIGERLRLRDLEAERLRDLEIDRRRLRRNLASLGDSRAAWRKRRRAIGEVLKARRGERLAERERERLAERDLERLAERDLLL